MPLEEEFITYICREEGARHTTQGHMGKHQFGQELGEQGNLGHTLRWGFHGKDKAGQGNILGLASLDNVGGLWARGVVSSYLVPGSR